MTAVQQADAARYPDPAYTALRAQLAGFHGVAPGRIVVAASASEFITRISAACAAPGGAVQVPAHAYGDYAAAARAHGLAVQAGPASSTAMRDVRLVWACEPSSPLGQPHAGLAAQVDAVRPGQVLVVDGAYAPLRLQGQPTLDAARRERVWQLWSPNKALGLTGVRAAYAIAPLQADGALLLRLAQLAPSWPLGAHGVALLQAWTGAHTQAWLADSLQQLRAWKARQQSLCAGFGWQQLPSDTNFFCARVPGADALAHRLQRLRAQGVQLRDCTSFGLPDHVRVAVLPPPDQDALVRAWAAG